MSVREDIAKKLAVNKGWEYGLLSQPYRNGLLEEADQILSHPRIAILAEDQSLPRLARGEDPSLYSWQEGQHSLILHNFRRIEK